MASSLKYVSGEAKRNRYTGFCRYRQGGEKIGVEVKYYSQPQRVKEKRWRDYYKFLENKQKAFQKLFMVAVFPDESDAEKGAKYLNAIAHEFPDVSFTTGYMQGNEFIPKNVFGSE
jgi:hypothetical protein